MEYNFLRIILLFSASITTTDSCPLLCQCNHKEVNCNRLAGDTIPAGIPADTVILNLENNRIKRITKNSLRYLTELKVLRLSNNNINTLEEGCFQDLKNLMKLDLARNDLSELYPGIFSPLKSLEILYLYNNKIETLDGLLEDLKNLKKLTLENNMLTEITNETFRNLEKLQHLKLSGNNISRISPVAFKSNQKLTMLSLASNPIRSIDNVLVNNLQVHYLDLMSCGLSKFPQGMPWTVKYLKLSKNNITRITKNDTLPYTFISVIILEDNGLNYVERGAFSHMGFLTDVLLIVNNLDSVPGPFPQSVRSVYLDKNKITSIAMDSFQHGTSLSVLSLRSNQIKELPPPSFANLRSIRELHLERNPFEKLHNNVFLFVRGLTYLTMNHLQVKDIYSNCFLGLDSVEKLELSFINVPKNNIYGNPFLSTPKLKSLTLQESPNLAQYILRNDDILPTLENLTSINLMDDRLQTLKPSFQKVFQNLQEIKLTGNPFVCDTNLIWLRKWMVLEPEKFHNVREIRCHSPQHLYGTAIVDVSITDFEQLGNTTTSYDKTETTTEDYYNHHDYDYHTDISNDTDESYNYYDHYYNYDDLTQEPGRKDSSFIITQIPNNTNGGYSNVTGNLMDQTNVNGEGSGEPAQKPKSSNIKAVGLAAGMSVAVVFAMLLIASIVYCFWRRKQNVVHDQTRQYKATDDYVFIVSKKDIEVQPKTRKLTREERGSTTSKASEDITNSADPTMKVYMLND